MKLNFNFLKKQKLTPQQIDSLYIKGILAYLNQVKKDHGKAALSKSIKTANTIHGIDGVFMINKELEIVFEQL